MTKRILGKWILFLVIIGFFVWWITKAESSFKTLFGMSCEVTRIPVVWNPEKNNFDPNLYTEELAKLTKKWYDRIDLIKEFTYGDQTIKILLGVKCHQPVLRINQEESINDIWVDHIEKKWSKLLMYWAQNWYATLISCDFGTLSGNTYRPFDMPKNSQQQENFSWTNNNSDTIKEEIQINGSSSIQETKLILEKKFLHPQDAFLLMRQPVSEIVKIFGWNWKRDRKELANMLNIENYRWTKSQNLQIRSYLISYITIQLQAIETPIIELSAKEYKTAQYKVVSELANLRWYTRKYDRWTLFQEIGENIYTYKWTRAQNLQIRKNLLTKIKPKN